MILLKPCIITPEQPRRPKFAELVEIFRQVEIEVAARARQLSGRWKPSPPKALVTPSEA
jgi:hypothetical protein